MRLFLDVETSGLWRADLPPEDASQPHIIQLGALLFDGQWRERASVEILVRPNGWTVEPEAYGVHGIATEDAERFGVPIEYALGLLQALSEKAITIVGHHIEFDRMLVGSELARIPGANGLWWRGRARAFRCTMEASTPVLRLQGQFGDKFPTLKEVHDFLFPAEAETFTVRHRAGDDLRATVRVFRELQQRGVMQ